jgi:PQQ-dependent dehydrogenase (methanol/ethanol family)
MTCKWLGSLVFAAFVAGNAAAQLGEITGKTIEEAEKYPNDWLTYHGSYRGWRHSALVQINLGNVRKLKVAWMHHGGRAIRGVQSTPLVADGVLYYSGAYNQIWALDGATGELLWAYRQRLNDDLVARQTHSPYNRGIALGYGNVYMGTLDGKLVAVSMETGKLAWETKLINSEKLTVGFTGAPLLVKDKIVIGAQGGEWPGRGPIYAVDARSGKKQWEFLTVGGTDAALATWGNDSWKTGGGGGWMPGSYDPKTNTLWWATGNPAPLYDWGGAEWKTKGARPGENLFTSSVIALNPDTGALKHYHQELPHDAWDFDSAAGEFVMLERDGKDLVVHPNKGGFVFVYNRKDTSAETGRTVLENVYQAVDNINFVKAIDPKTGALVGRRDLSEGMNKGLCPYIGGGFSWNAGSFSPGTGLYYRAGNEWCMDVDVLRTQPITEPVVQLNIGANFRIAPATADGKKPRGHVRARDPISGKLKFEIPFAEPPLASLLTTKGNLLFIPDARGWLRAYDARTGKEMWSFNNGIGHNGGIISYAAKGKQYIAVTTGWGSLASGDYGSLWGGVFKDMAIDDGGLVVFTVP